MLVGLAAREDWALFAGCYESLCVGAALAHLEALSGERLARLALLYVEPAAREVGVGRRLLDEVADWATVAGCSGLDVPTLPGDRLTKSLLEAAGHRARLVVMHRPLRRPPDR